MPAYTLYYFNHRGRAEICRMLFAAAGIQYNDRRIDFSEWNGFRNKMPGSMLPVLEIDGRMQIPQSMAISRYLAREFGYHGKNNIDMARIDYISDSFYDIMDDYMRMYHDRDGRMMWDRMTDMRQRYTDLDGRMTNTGSDMSSDTRSDMWSDTRPEMRSDMQSDMRTDMQRGTMQSGMRSDFNSGLSSDMGTGTNSGSFSESFNEGVMYERRRRYMETCRRVLPFMERTLEMHHNGNQYFMGDQMTMCDVMCYAALESPMHENPSLLSNYPKLRSLRDRVASHAKISTYFKRRNFSDF